MLHRPETIARALALLELRGDERLLVVGAGSGYAAAVAALLAREVVATERVPQLAARATRNLRGAVRVLAVDGTQGVPAGAAVRRGARPLRRRPRTGARRARPGAGRASRAPHRPPAIRCSSSLVGSRSAG